MIVRLCNAVVRTAPNTLKLPTAAGRTRAWGVLYEVVCSHQQVQDLRANVSLESRVPEEDSHVRNVVSRDCQGLMR